MKNLVEGRAYAWISLGALLGSNLRYVLSKVVTRYSDAAFPWATLLINVSGSLVLGFFLIWTTERVSPIHCGDGWWPSAFVDRTLRSPATPLRPWSTLSRATGRSSRAISLPTTCFAWGRSWPEALWPARFEGQRV